MIISISCLMSRNIFITFTKQNLMIFQKFKVQAFQNVINCYKTNIFDKFYIIFPKRFVLKSLRFLLYCGAMHIRIV